MSRQWTSERAILRGICRYSLPLLMAICLLALKPEELGKPLSETAPLIEARNYTGAVDKLNAYAKSASEAGQLAEIYYLIGFIHHDYTHDYDQALEVYQKVVDMGKKSASPEGLEPYLALSKMSIAGIYRRISQYQNAIEIYKEVAADYPGTEYAAVAVRGVKGIKDALTEIERQREVIDRFPATELAAEAQFEIAELYRAIQNLNNPQQGIQEYAKLVDEYPNSRRAAEAQLRIGNIYWTILHEPEKAVSAYQKLAQEKLSASGFEAEAFFRIGRIRYNDLHDYEGALEVFTEFLGDYPTYWKFPAAIYWQGMCYEQLKDYDSAIRAFEAFIQVYPDENPGWLVDIERHGDENAKARIQTKIENLRKLASEAKWNGAERLRSQSKYRQALAIYRELIIKYPDSEYSKKARNLIDDMIDLAEIQICRDAVKRKDVGAAASQFRIAEIYETRVRDYPLAVKEYEKTAKSYRGTYWAADALYRLGIIYSGAENGEKPDYDKAIGKYRQLIREYRNTNTAAKAYYQMAEIYRIHLKDYSQALEAYNKAANAYPRRDLYEGKGYKNSLADEAQFKMGRIYYENLRDYDTAFKIFTEFLNDYPDSCRKAAAYSFIAAIHEQQNNREAAASDLEQIIDIIVESDVQSAFFIREALHDGSREREIELSGFELQRNIMKQLMRKVSRLRARVASGD